MAARARHRLATPILLLFRCSGPATPIITLAIPVSVVASFVAMAAMGRSIHVISPAGLAFSVGMAVDAAIVVLENIYRLRRQGLAPARTAYQCARQVWGAILVSALTTVMVFIPILILDLEVGPLFRDIAVATIAATRTRIRPIFVSTLTSVSGMLPLVLFPRRPGSGRLKGRWTTISLSSAPASPGPPRPSN
jgi:multidrug efflux pump subunit AcrB